MVSATSARGLEVIGGTDVAHQVERLVKDARELLILTTAYLDTWRHLAEEIRIAHERGVQIHVVIRAAEGPAREQDKRKRAMGAIDKWVTFHSVERLHAKVYISESRAIISSMNLVASSRDSIEIGVSFSAPELIDEAFAQLARYCPSISDVRRGGRKTDRTARRSQPGVSGYCMGCGESKELDPTKPLCRSCYKASSRGTELDQLPDRVCHVCGSSHAATLARPLCFTCFKSLTKAEQQELKDQLN